MNLIEARKLAHEGWVRSATKTGNNWSRLCGPIFVDSTGSSLGAITETDLDAEDWEPKPATKTPFDCELLVHDDGSIRVMKPSHDLKSWELCGWRKIRVREVEG